MMSITPINPIGGGNSEKLINGGFDTDTGWTKGSEWTISGGTANCDGTQVANSYLSQPGAIIDRLYYYSYTISNYSAGSIAIFIGGAGPSVSANGIYTGTIVAGGVNFTLRANADFVGSVDNFSIR